MTVSSLVCGQKTKKNEFAKKNEWLVINKGKLGCSVSRSVGNASVDRTMSMKMSTEWINGQVSFSNKISVGLD